jgi:2-polyprenyl-6-methoxyphenol hydroxylase-like FAD-dependent oxidoreductase
MMSAPSSKRRQTDVAIVGGGLAGSIAAAMLGRAGIDAVLIDPHAVYPEDFRCEKLDGSQMRILEKTGLADAVLRATTPDREVSVARFGRVVETRPGDQRGIFYAPLVNTVRAEIPEHVALIAAKATEMSTSASRQTITLSNGEQISARLIVLANGLNIGLRHTLGMTRKIISECHSVSIGFDIKPAGRRMFDFSALTYYAEKTSDRTALLTLFPIGSSMRANLFVYRDMKDPWLRQMRDAPQDALFAIMPGLRKLIGDFEVTSFIKIRPVDLYVTEGHRQPGIVLVGDAFATSCPAAGTGALKVLTDVERLCNVYIPRWLETPDMGEEKIAAFYDDAVKTACDDFSVAKAYQLRSFSVDAGLRWSVRRWIKFIGQSGRGALRRIGGKFSMGSQNRRGKSVTSGVAGAHPE